MPTLINLFITLIFYSNILIFFTSILPVADSIYFKISSFDSNTNNILYRGAAFASSGSVQFNDPDYTCLVGQAISTEKFPVWDSKSGKITDFETRFSFTIDTLNLPTSSYGDGFVFFLAPLDFQIPPNSVGSYHGLFNISNYRKSSQNQIVVIEFDSYSDSWDPPNQHVGININSLTSSNYTDWNAADHSGNAAQVIVSYNAKTMMLVASWTYDYPTFLENSSVSYQVNLKEVLPEWAMIGFSAATGKNTEKNLLHYWEFNSSLNVKWKSTDQSSGSGKRNEFLTNLLIGISAFVGTIVIVIVAYIIRWSMKRRGVGGTRVSTNQVGLAMRYSYNDLVLATNNFSDENKLGEGGSGEVYKGCLPNSDKTQVAVKKISESATQGSSEYMTEIATISRLTHRNVVRLVGWCQDKTRFLLAYEVMSNGSLDTYLFGEKQEPLDWGKRYKIVQDLASALLYMHEEYSVYEYVVHRDIKPSNVLLDSEFNAKLGDFGFARFINHDMSGLNSTKVAGTIGYVAPEYMESRKASKASDMYSFGVVVLNIGSGKKANLEETDGHPSSRGFTTLVKWVRHLDETGNLHLCVDEKLKGRLNKEEYECLMKLGLCCTQEDATKRPTIRDVVRILNLKVKKPFEAYVDVADPIIDTSSVAGSSGT